MIKALIIDDEFLARENLKLLIDEFCEGISVVGTIGNIKEAKAEIEKISPDVVFLDIRMPSGAEGFDLLDQLESINFQVVFVTAFKEYAIRAFKANAIDYILKPVEIEELQKTAKKLTSNLIIQEIPNESKQQLNSAFESIRKQDIERIAVPHQKGIKLFEVNKISHLESRSNYSEIHFIDGTTFLDSRTLKFYEEILPSSFIRVHHSFIVNLNEIIEYSNEDGHSLIIKSGSMIPVSRVNVKKVLELIQKL